MNGAGIDPEFGVTLSFSSSGISGWSGCNSYGLAYEDMQIDGEHLVIPGVATNQEGCEPETPEAEYYETLTDVSSYQRSGSALELLNEGETVLKFEPVS